MNTSILEKLDINKGSPEYEKLNKVFSICKKWGVTVSSGYFKKLLILELPTKYEKFKGEVAIETIVVDTFNPLNYINRIILSNGLVLPTEVLKKDLNKGLEILFTNRTQSISPLFVVNAHKDYIELIILLCKYVFDEPIINIRVKHGIASTSALHNLINAQVIKNMYLENKPNSLFVSMYVFVKKHENFSKGDILLGNASNTINDLYAQPNTPLNFDKLKRDIAVINNKDSVNPMKYMVLNPFNVLLSDDEEIEEELRAVTDCNRLCDVCLNTALNYKKCSVKKNMDLYIRILLNIQAWKKKLQ